MSVGIFLPIRKGSVRVKDKNLRKFADFDGGLLELKLRQLIKVREVEEIVISTNDERAAIIAENFKQFDSRIAVEARPDELAASNTDLSQLILHVPGLFSSENILWTHVTSPFCDEAVYSKAIRMYGMNKMKEFDSLVSVTRFQNFLWDPIKNDLINRNGNKNWPNTQDLKVLQEINNAIFIAPKETYSKRGNRVGERPFLFEMNKILSLDIDEVEDFICSLLVFSFLR